MDLILAVFRIALEGPAPTYGPHTFGVWAISAFLASCMVGFTVGPVIALIARKVR